MSKQGRPNLFATVLYIQLSVWANLDIHSIAQTIRGLANQRAGRHWSKEWLQKHGSHLACSSLNIWAVSHLCVQIDAHTRPTSLTPSVLRSQSACFWPCTTECTFQVLINSSLKKLTFSSSTQGTARSSSLALASSLNTWRTRPVLCRCMCIAANWQIVWWVQ